MKCPSELTYSMYIDRELSREEARQVEEHLAVCAGCRARVEALSAETRLLTEILQEIGPLAAPAVEGWRAAMKMLVGFLAMVGVAVACVAAVSWLGDLFPSAVARNLFNRATWINLFFTAGLYLADQGANMLYSIVSVLSTLIVAFLLVGGLYLVVRRRLTSLAILASLAMILMAAPASAIETRGGQSVLVPTGQTINGTLLAGGESVTIEGTINGDLITWARRVVIRGAVKGDVVDFSQRLEVEGTVDGNLFTFAQVLGLRGTVARSMYGFVQAFHVYPNGHVNSDLVAGTGEIDLAGTVGRDVALFCGAAEVRGNVGRDLKARAGVITLSAPARVGGDFTARVERTNQVQIEPGVTIVGKTDVELVKRAVSRYARPRFYFWQAVQLLAALLTGVVVFRLWPFLFAARAETAGSTLLAAGVGFLVCVATPIAAFIAGVTIVGLPLAIMTLFAWLVGLYLAKVFVAALVGRTMMHATTNDLGSFAVALLVGLAIVFVGMNLPYLGGLIKFIVILLGLGLAFMQLYKRWRQTAPQVG